MNQREFFDSNANEWASRLRHQPERLEFIVNKMNISTGMRVLDVGSGTGVLIPYLKKAVKDDGLITASDFSSNMLSVSKNNNSGSEAFFVQSDAHNLPFKAGSFDVVVCFSAMPHFEDKQLVFREFSRVLNISGRFYLIHLASSQKINAMHRLVHSDVAHCHMPGKNEIEKILRCAGIKKFYIIENDELYFVEAYKP